MVVESIVEIVAGVLGQGGYFTLFLLMTLESMVIPVPSEAVMPLAGFLIGSGGFSWLGVFISSSIGSIVGSLISYYIGLYGGRGFVRRFGRFFLLDESHLERAEEWFKRRGGITIFLSRFVPGVRHIISIPAGMARMNIARFLVFTFAGATIWNLFLAFIGRLLNEKWYLVHQYSTKIDIIVLIILVLGICWFVYKNIRKR